MSADSDSGLLHQSKADHVSTLPSDRRPSGKRHSTLSIPPLPSRRSSSASIFSELSELEYMSNNYDGRLVSTVSNTRNTRAYSNTGPVNLRQRLQNLYYQNYGALLVLLSQAFGCGMTVSAQLLEKSGAHGAPMHPLQILFARQALTSLICFAYALATKSIPHFPLGPPDRKIRLLLVCRGLGGCFGVLGVYLSLLYLPLSEATVLTFLAPVLTCILCSFVLPDETFTRQQQIASLVSFIGVISIAQPVSFFSSSTASSTSPAIDHNISPSNTTSDSLNTHDSADPSSTRHLLAVGIAMMGAAGSTVAMTSIRAIGTRAHAFISVNYFSVWSVIVSVVGLLIVPNVSFRFPGNLIEWSLLLSLGLCGFVMQSLLTMGLSYGGPANKSEPKATPLATTTNDTQAQLTTKATENDVERQSRQSRHAPSGSSPTPVSSYRKPETRPSGNRATSMLYTQLIFALIADKTIFHVTIGLWSWLGMGLIISGAIWVATAKDGNKKDTSVSASTNRHTHESRPGRHGTVTDSEGLAMKNLHRVGNQSGSRSTRGESEEAVGLLGGDTAYDSEEDSSSSGSMLPSGSNSNSNPNPESASSLSTARPSFPATSLT